MSQGCLRALPCAPGAAFVCHRAHQLIHVSLATTAPTPQGFPSIVSSLTRQPVSDALRAAVAANQRVIAPGANLLLLNGLLVEVANFELYGGLVGGRRGREREEGSV